MKYHKNWEEIRRARSYISPKNWLSYIPIKPTKPYWIYEFFCFGLFFIALLLLIWLYVTERDPNLIIVLFVLGIFNVLLALNLWVTRKVLMNDLRTSHEESGIDEAGLERREK